MASRLQRRQRYLRRRAHAAAARRSRLAPEVPVESSSRAVTPVQRRTLVEIIAKNRRRCPVCQRSERVKKDGTFGLHTATIDGKRVDCPGVGMPG